MPTPILMPALSPTMEEGKLARWLVKEGQKVRSGDVIAEIETDKATMEVEAVDEGTIGRIIVPGGTEGVKVNSQIALLLGEGESAASMAAPVSPALAAPAAPMAAPTAAAPMSSVAPVTMAAAAQASPPPVAATTGDDDGRIHASPLAKRIAKASGIVLGTLTGTGPNGRILARDVAPNGATASAGRSAAALGAAAGPVLATAAAAGAAAAGRPATASQVPATTSGLPMAMSDDKVLALYEKGSYDIKPHDGMRRIIAKRLVESKTTIPHFYLTVDCRLDELLSARERLNKRSPKDGPGAYKLSVNDFLIKALALALRDVPDANATWTEAGMLRHKRIDVGVAVAVEGGLFTPVLRHADLKTLAELSNEIKDLAGRARTKKLAPHEYQGGTTSISNLGMFGIKKFDAVINPPHATILAVGAGEEQAVVVDGKLAIATMMSATLSCDHRVVDGALGANVLQAFKAYVEDPVRMLV